MQRGKLLGRGLPDGAMCFTPCVKCQKAPNDIQHQLGEKSRLRKSTASQSAKLTKGLLRPGPPLGCGEGRHTQTREGTAPSASLALFSFLPFLLPSVCPFSPDHFSVSTALQILCTTDLTEQLDILGTLRENRRQGALEKPRRGRY